jgi:ribosomal protein S18 acetylase RimI-like enzyme
VDGPTLGLAVTEGNPAVRLYERLGFRRVLTSFSVQL